MVDSHYILGSCKHVSLGLLFLRLYDLCLHSALQSERPITPGYRCPTRALPVITSCKLFCAKMSKTYVRHLAKSRPCCKVRKLLRNTEPSLCLLCGRLNPITVSPSLWAWEGLESNVQPFVDWLTLSFIFSSPLHDFLFSSFFFFSRIFLLFLKDIKTTTPISSNTRFNILTRFSQAFFWHL